MHKADYYKELGATAACCIRLAESLMDSGDILYGDSYFGQEKTSKKLYKDLQIHSVLAVKQSHVRYPKSFLKLKMKDWPAGTSLVLPSCFDDRNLIAIGYKYHSKKVAYFISTYGSHLTSNGEPYISKFVFETGNYALRDVARP